MRKIYFLLSLLVITAGACKKSETSVEAPVTPVPSTNLPASAKPGVVFINNGSSAIVTLYAPLKKTVFLIGDFNGWSPTASAMKNTADGLTWWIQIDNLQPGKSYAYQFLVDGDLKVADPYCEKVLDPDNDSYIDQMTYPGLMTYPTGKTTGIVSVMQSNQVAYTWKNTSGFKRPEKNNLVIYELLIRDFTAEHSYASTLKKIDYLSALGVNAIELMPVNEFEGNLSWGYNPSFYFAPDKYYGTKAALQNFIDECHGRGIAVILDMVLNHSFGQSPMVQLYFDKATGKPAANNPWFNVDATHPYNVGYDFNHEKAATKTFVKNVVKFWMEEYKIDGFRFDLSKGFSQRKASDDAAFSAYDASRVAIWKDYNNYIKGIDPNNFYVILEHFAEASEEKVLADEGMILWNNLNYNVNEGTMGYLGNSDFSWGFFAKHGFSKSDNLVNFIESHDEERTMFKNLEYGNSSGTYQVKDLVTALKREEMAAAFLFTIPGPKMMWQFEELGYDVSIDFNGRTGNKPIRWEYAEQRNRKALYNAYAKFINLKKHNTVYNSSNVVYDLTGAVKYIKISDASNTVVVVGNYDVVNQTASVDFGSSGAWIDQSNREPVNFSSRIYSKSLTPGEYHIFSKSALTN
jgi:1,4-alpha-glucan branching enzyme